MDTVARTSGSYGVTAGVASDVEAERTERAPLAAGLARATRAALAAAVALVTWAMLAAGAALPPATWDALAAAAALAAGAALGARVCSPPAMHSTDTASITSSRPGIKNEKRWR